MAAKTTIGNQASAALNPESMQEPKRMEETAEEREEALMERENALAAREARLAALETRMTAALERSERAIAGTKSAEDLADEPKIEYDAQGKPIPRLELDMPFGIVIGDPDLGFVQNGHRFSKDKRYVGEEQKGVGKPFNIKMLGIVKVVSKAS